VLAVLVGAVSGLGAVAFQELLDFFHTLFFTHLVSALSSFGRYDVILLPALGGIGVGILVQLFAREAEGHGVPEVMLAVSRFGGRIRGRVSIMKALASSLCIGSGGSAGRVGPIVQIGSSAASFLGQRFGLSGDWLRVLVACGAAGGISATFNAPIAGVFFALELILRSFSVQNFGIVVISSVTALVVSQPFLGESPVFLVPAYALNANWEFGLYALLGVSAAVLGIGLIRLLYLMEDLFDNIPKFPKFAKPMLGGLAVGAIGVFYPEVFGVGYDSIGDALTGSYTFKILVVIALLKILATSFTLGSGGSGGVFAPSLFIGAMSGTAFGNAARFIIPGLVSPAAAFGLVGMGAVFAGTARAPITAIIIVFEMTRDYEIILPLMLAVVVSTIFSRLLSRESIYTVKLIRRGIFITSASHEQGADNIPVGDIMVTSYPSVYVDFPIRDIPGKFSSEGVHGLPVLDYQDRLVGIVTATDVGHAISNGYEGGQAFDIASRSLITAFKDQTIFDVFGQPGAQEIGYIPVVDRDHPNLLLGVLRRQDVIQAFADAAQRREAHASHEMGENH
jgi:CIC family chloride channel protein